MWYHNNDLRACHICVGVWVLEVQRYFVRSLGACDDIILSIKWYKITDSHSNVSFTDQHTACWYPSTKHKSYIEFYTVASYHSYVSPISVLSTLIIIYDQLIQYHVLADSFCQKNT